MKNRLRRLLMKYLPLLQFLQSYRTGGRRIVKPKRARDAQFDAFLNSCQGYERCLQIGVKEMYGQKFGNNWESVDLFDQRDFIDHHYDIQEMPFEDNSFDAVVCISILEHVPHPEQAICEMNRILKPGGYIWVQLPFNYPFHGATDYWRVSPDGLRIWMRDFKEKCCDAFLPHRTSLVVSSYFYGRKLVDHKASANAAVEEL